MDLLATVVVDFFEVSVMGSDLVVEIARDWSMDGGCAVGVEVEAAAVEGVCGVVFWLVSLGCMEVGSMLKDEGDLLSYWWWWEVPAVVVGWFLLLLLSSFWESVRSIV